MAYARSSSWLVAGPACSSGLLVLAGRISPTYCCSHGPKAVLPVPYREDVSTPDGRRASCLRHCLLGTLEFLWLEKVECDFMEIGPEVVINLAVVGYVQ